MEEKVLLDYQKRYGIIFLKKSGKVLSNEDLSENKTFLKGNETEGYDKLEKIILNKDVNKVIWNGLGRWAFKSFEVAPDNQIFQEFEGVLYTKKGYDRCGNNNRKK